MTTVNIDEFKDDGSNQELTANICQNSAMGQYACTNAAQCWEPCGELGHSAEHAITSDEQVLLPLVSEKPLVSTRVLANQAGDGLLLLDIFALKA